MCQTQNVHVLGKRALTALIAVRAAGETFICLSRAAVGPIAESTLSASRPVTSCPAWVFSGREVVTFYAKVQWRMRSGRAAYGTPRGQVAPSGSRISPRESSTSPALAPPPWNPEIFAALPRLRGCCPPQRCWQRRLHLPWQGPQGRARLSRAAPAPPRREKGPSRSNGGSRQPPASRLRASEPRDATAGGCACGPFCRASSARRLPESSAPEAPAAGATTLLGSRDPDRSRGGAAAR